MPCMKCNNGKWKYGERGKCVFLTKERCEKARQAIHASEQAVKNVVKSLYVKLTTWGAQH